MPCSGSSQAYNMIRGSVHHASALCFRISDADREPIFESGELIIVGDSIGARHATMEAPMMRSVSFQRNAPNSGSRLVRTGSVITGGPEAFLRGPR